MSDKPTKSLPRRDAQLDLYTTWPAFEVISGGLAGGMRQIAGDPDTAAYALVSTTTAFPEDISWSGQCPWGIASPDRHLQIRESLGEALAGMLFMERGRSVELNDPRGDWSRLVCELLETTASQPFTLRSSGIDKALRGAWVTPSNQGLAMLYSSAMQSQIEPPKAARKLLDAITESGAPPTDGSVQMTDDGGMSTILILTSELAAG